MINSIKNTEVWSEDKKAYRKDFQVFDYARSGVEFFASHLPLAQHVEKSLVWTEVDGVAGMLPKEANLLEVFAKAGFNPARPALVYDGGNALYAARLAWALEVAGWAEVYLLEGGLAAWQQTKYPAEFGIGSGTSIQSRLSKNNRRKDLYATTLDVLEKKPGTVLLDTRSLAEFTGKEKKAKRAGRIPNSVHWEWKRGLAADGLHFRSAEELAQEFASFGITAETEVITYCQSGVRASHALYALHRAGITKVRNYDGSWEEWGNRLDLPIEKEET